MFCPIMRFGTTARVFFLWNKNSFQAFNSEQNKKNFQKWSVGVSKIDDFRHVDMEGENNDPLRILRHPKMETSLLRKFRKSVSAMP